MKLVKFPITERIKLAIREFKCFVIKKKSNTKDKDKKPPTPTQVVS
jgi:hypothetical protein